MSSTVDSRVVEMRFDNSNFERNVSKTMSTLSKLKEKLKFSGASKGLEDINAAAKHVNMSSLGGAVDAVKAKFSALDVVAITALTNITNSAVNAGKKLVSSLTFDQVAAGWNKFSDKTKSVATLVAQGNDIEDVNDQLSRLNWFTDETSYNFTDMVSNIAKFTATGKDLNESVTAMEGIANWAALSGQNAGTASRAMYQLSQAMGAGLLRLEDYKSIQNASMDTEEFRQKCIDAALELGTLQEVSDGLYASLNATGKGAEAFNISQFTTQLTQGAWLTSDVMMKVFNDYASAVDGIYEAAEEKGLLASEIIDEIYTTAQQYGISTDEAIYSLGYNFDSFALKAFEAAQKARTFEDAIDSVKDAVSTGWMNTFELIFGDAEGATKLWTDVANQMYDIFATGGERRNEILETSMLYSGWDKVIERVNEAGLSADAFEQKVAECAEASGIDVDALTNTFGTLGKAFENGAVSTDILTEAVDFFNNSIGQTKTNVESVKEVVKGLSVDLSDVLPGKYGNYTIGWASDEVESVKKIQTALNELGDSSSQLNVNGIFESETRQAVIDFQKSVGLAATGFVDQKTIDAMNKAGESLERINETTQEVEQSFADSKIEIEDLYGEIEHLSGRELVFNTIHNTLEAIVTILGTFRDAWAEIFPTDRVAFGLRNFLEKIHSISEAFILSDNNAEKLKDTFKGIISIIDILSSIVGGALKAAFDVIGEVFNIFDFDILTITSNIGNVITAFKNWLSENEVITGAFEGLTNAISVVIYIIKGLIDAFKNMPGVSKILTEIRRGFIRFSLSAKDMDHAMKKVVEWFKSLKDLPFIKNLFEKVKTSFASFIDYIPIGISKLKEWFNAFKQTDAVQYLISVVEDLIDAIKKLFNGDISFSEFATVLGDSLGSALTSIPGIALQLGSDFIAGFKNGLSDNALGVVDNIIEFCSNFISAFKSALGIHSPSHIAYEDGVFFLEGFINGLKSMISAVADFLKEVGDKVVDIFKKIWDKVKDIGQKIDWDKVFKVTMLVITVTSIKKIADAFGSVSNLLDSASGVLDSVRDVVQNFGGVLKGFTKVLKGVALDYTAKAMIKMAIAIGILVAAVLAIVYVAGDNYAGLWNAVGVVAVLATIIGLLTFAMSKLSGSSVSLSKNGLNVDGLNTAILQLGITIALIVYATKMLGNLDDQTAEKGFTRLATIAIGMVAAIGILALVSPLSKNADKIGSSMLKISAAMVIMAFLIKRISALDDKDISKGIQVMKTFVLFIVELGVANGLAGKNGDKFGGNVLKIAIAMGVLVIVLKMLSGMKTYDIMAGIDVLKKFGTLIVEMAVCNRIAGSNSSKFGSTALGIAASMMILAGVIWVLSKIDDADIENGISIIQKFAVLIVELCLASRIGGSGGKALSKNILAMSVAIGILALIAWLLGSVPVENLAKGVIAVSILGIVMSKMIAACRGAKNITGSIIAMTIAIGVMAGAVYALTQIDDTKKLAGAVIAIGSLMIIFGIMAKMATSSKHAKKSVGALIALAGVVALMARILILMSALELKNTLEIAISLGIMMIAFAASLKIISTIKSISTSAYDGLVAMVLVLGVIAIILGILASCNVGPTLEIAISLSMLLLALSTSCLILAAGAAVMSLASAGILGMVKVILVMGVLMAAIAALATWQPDLNSFLEKALPVLNTIGRGIGEFIGGIMTSIGNAALGLMEQFGTSLSNFMANVKPCLESLKSVDSSSLAGAGYLTAIILALSTADLVAGFVSIATLGQGSLAVVGAGLQELGKGVAEFCSAASSVDASAVEAAKNVSSIISELSTSTLIEHVNAFLGGTTDYSGLGEKLKTFGTAVTEFSSVISGKIDSDSVKAAKLAGDLLVQLNESLPRQDGTLQKFFGEQDLGSFGTACEEFASCMVTICESLSGDNFSIPEDKITQLTTAGTQFATLNKAIPRKEGTLQEFFGEQDLEDFGAGCLAFANNMIVIAASLSPEKAVIPSDKITQLTTAGTQFATLNKAIPRKEGTLQEFFGEQDLEDFGAGCLAFANNMIVIAASLSPEKAVIPSDKITQLTEAGNQFAALNKAIPRKNGKLQKFFGDQDLKDFGTACEAFVNNMITIAASLSPEKAVIPEDKITQLTEAGNQFSDLANSLPKDEGLLQKVVGKEDLTGFGESCAAFARCMNRVNLSLLLFNVDTDRFDKLAAAGTAMSELQGTLPEQGGWWSTIAGEQDIGLFGDKIKQFGVSMCDFSESLSDFTTTKIDLAISVARRIKTIAEECSQINYDGIDTFIYDGVVSGLGTVINNFSDSVKDINIEAVSTSVEAVDKLKDLIVEVSALKSSGLENFKINAIGKSVKDYSDTVTGFDNSSVMESITAADKIREFINSLASIDNSGIIKFTPVRIGNSLNAYASSIKEINLADIITSGIGVGRVKNIIDSLVDIDNSGIEKFTPISIGDAIKDYSIAVSGINLAAISNSITAAETLRGFISSLSSIDSSGTSSFANAVNDLSGTNFSGVSNVLNEYSQSMQNDGQSLMKSLNDGIESGLNNLVTSVNDTLSKLIRNIRSKSGLFASAGSMLSSSLSSGFSYNVGSLTSAARGAISDMITSIRNTRYMFTTVGQYLVEGFARGIELYTYVAKEAAKKMAKEAKDAAKQELDVNSPSRVFMAIGGYVAEGFAKGITSNTFMAESSAHDMALTAINTTRNAMAAMVEALNEDMNEQPTIRPIMDLTDVKTGIDAISGMFSSPQTIGIRSNVNAINRAVNEMHQNGRNDDVVSAINSLNDNLEKVKGDVYNFGGFTYDDGSNISDAVETLVRYAKIGRRR